ncbi:MAG TPA: hypothetical protein VJQ83_13755, partial [Tepidiformaceae bacterium]|nr:hypothetical protein [Tepidiformaceae bacterium]
MYDKFRTLAPGGRARLLAVPLLVVAVLVTLIGAATAASAVSEQVALINGGFESGNTVGWTPSCDGGCTNESITVVPDINTEAGSYAAQEGNFFAALLGSCHNTTLSQTFNGQAGQTLAGQAFFANNESAADTFGNYNDYGSVQILQGDTVVATLFSSDGQSVGGDSGTPWTPFSFTVPATGAYTIVATSGNGGDCNVDSVVGVDFVSALGGLTVAPATQLWGNAITISSPGGGLSGTTSVLMNGSPAPFVVLNDSTVSARVVPGAGAGAVTLSITVPSGTAIVPNAFTAIPPVTVTLPTTTPTPPPSTTPSPTATPTETSTPTPTSTATATPTPASECPSPAIELSGAATLTTWPGPNNASIADVVANCGLSSVTAVWTY